MLIFNFKYSIIKLMEANNRMETITIANCPRLTLQLDPKGLKFDSN